MLILMIERITVKSNKTKKENSMTNHETKFAFTLPEGVEEGDHVMEFQIPYLAEEKLKVLGGLGMLRTNLDTLTEES